MGFGGSVAEGDRALANEGIRVEASDDNCGVRHRKASLRSVYRGGEDGGIHQVTQGATNNTAHTGGEEGRVKVK